MRSIDADALIDDLKHDIAMDQDSLDYEELTDSNREIIQFDKDCKQKAIDLLQNAPTIEPERKKGKWIDNETSYADGVRQTCTCSVCGQRSVRPLGRFCRWCGADMSEDNE